MPPLTTAATMSSEHLPDGTRAEEFLRDADLVGYRERALAALSPGDEGYEAAREALKAARRAAALTAATLAEVEAAE